MRLPSRILGLLSKAKAPASPQPYPSPATVSQTAPVDGQGVTYRLMAPSLDVSLVISALKDLSNSIENEYGIQEIPVAITASKTIILTKSAPPTILNIESLFTGLLRGVVILGRVSGFRRSGDMLAFKASLMVQGPS
ncbi:hypothetical protein HFD88_005123 [Aspergillus terreus]|nr:hypothetical protein HFD88_005123 [Aspergillus terreus]